MNNKKESISSDFINFGSYPAGEVAILKPELEKKGIPVKVMYPGSSIGVEATAFAAWPAYKIMIRNTDIKSALEVCNMLNIKPRNKIPLPQLLYTKVNRYLFGIIVAIWLIIIILGNFGKLQNDLLISLLICPLFFVSLLFTIITSYKIIKKYSKKVK